MLCSSMGLMLSRCILSTTSQGHAELLEPVWQMFSRLIRPATLQITGKRHCYFTVKRVSVAGDSSGEWQLVLKCGLYHFKPDHSSTLNLERYSNFSLGIY